MGKIEGSTVDSKTVKRVESEDESQLRNLTYFAYSGLAITSTAQMFLPRLTFLCHSRLPTSIC
jgi:hypothetical protein